MNKLNLYFKIILTCLFLAENIFPFNTAWGNELSASSTPINTNLTHLPLIQGVKFYPEQPLKLDFIFSGGRSLSPKDINALSQESIRYFLTALAIPDQDFWVNLSPYEHDRIIPENFGQTAMGQATLEQDYLLKQLTGAAMNPETHLGAAFWEKVYESAYEQFGITNIPTETFHKIWIIPQKAVIQESADKALIEDSSMNVLMENDYIAQAAAQGNIDPKTHPPETSKEDQLVTEVFKKIVLPEITRSINEDPQFAELHRIYHAMILATWFKQKLKNTILDQSYIGKNKTQGLENTSNTSKEDIYQKYLKLFSNTSNNVIKEEYDPETQSIIPRKYFSGGLKMAVAPAMLVKSRSGFRLSNWMKKLGTATFFIVTASLTAFGQTLPNLSSTFQMTQPINTEAVASTPEILTAPLMRALEQAIKETPQNPTAIEKKNTIILKVTLANLRRALKGEFNPVKKDDSGDITMMYLSPLKKLKKTDRRTQPVLDAYDDLQGFHAYNIFDPQKPTLLLIHGMGRGAYNTFNPFFNELNTTHNIVFFNYNEAEPLENLTDIFITEWQEFTQAHPSESPLTVLAYSYGNILFRSVVLKKPFREAQYIALAAPFAGSRLVRLLSYEPTALGIKIFSPNWYEPLRVLDMSGKTMKRFYNPKANAIFFSRIKEQFVIQVEDDNHNPRTNLKTKFRKRYDAALGKKENVTILPKDEQFAFTPSSHTNLPYYPKTMQIVKKLLGIDKASLQKAPTPVGGIDFNAKFLDLSTKQSKEMTIFLQNLQKIQMDHWEGISFEVNSIKPLKTISYFNRKGNPNKSLQ